MPEVSYEAILCNLSELQLIFFWKQRNILALTASILVRWVGLRRSDFIGIILKCIHRVGCIIRNEAGQVSRFTLFSNRKRNNPYLSVQNEIRHEWLSKLPVYLETLAKCSFSLASYVCFVRICTILFWDEELNMIFVSGISEYTKRV